MSPLVALNVGCCAAAICPESEVDETRRARGEEGVVSNEVADFLVRHRLGGKVSQRLFL
jgi:hypothetical protein